MRALTQIEKAALAKALSQALKDSNAAQFKWLPVSARGSGPIGYCGLVNVKSSRGGYVGFRRFFAMIAKGPQEPLHQGSDRAYRRHPCQLRWEQHRTGAS
jgi:hypothetical protein